MLPEDRKAGGLVAPPGAYQRSDVEYYSRSYMTPLKPGTGWPRSPKRSSKLPVYLFTLFVLLCAVFLVFVLIVRPRTPQFRLSEVSVKTLTYAHNSTQPDGGSSSASLNATLVAMITISNPNFGRFDHENATVTVVYAGGLIIGEQSVGQGRVGAKTIKRVEVAIDVGVPVRASEASGEVTGNFTRDVGAGLVKLRSYGRVNGKVYLMGSGVNRRKTAVMNCEMKLNLNSRSVQDVVCQ